MRAQPLTRRKRRLEGLIPTNNATLSRVLSVEEHGRDLFEAVQRLDLEGIVAKRKRDPVALLVSRAPQRFSCRAC